MFPYNIRRSRTRSERSGWASTRRGRRSTSAAPSAALDNLYVTDGSALPRSGGVNPSLTIAANALRTGTHIAASL